MANLNINIGDLQLKNPVMTASGTFGYGEEFADFIDISQIGGIIVKGTTKGAISDFNGNFELDVDHLPVTLIASYIGYVKQEVKVSTNHHIKIVMASDDNLMSEVVVTGYGTFKKSAYAGSASTVKTAALQDVPTVDFKDLLQGSAPGVQLSSTSGQPGASSSINIRGMGYLDYWDPTEQAKVRQ